MLSVTIDNTMSKSKSVKQAPAIVNRRARFDYELTDELEVGLVLTGPEVRAARDSHVQLKGAFVTIRQGALWLNNASFSLKLTTKGDAHARSIDTSPRKLLAHRAQIAALEAKKQQGSTIVPLKLLTRKNHIKLIIAIGRGKKNYDKRETLKRRDQAREAQRAIKQHY